MSDETTDDPGVDSRVARNGGISYLHIPAVDIRESAAFYENALGWKIHGADGERLSFEDGGGFVAGAWVTDQAVAREPGLLPYVYVDHLDAVVDNVVAHGGEIVRAPYPEGNLWVATFRDPAGNVIGLWQEGPR